MYKTTDQCQAVLARSSREFAAFFVPENDTTEYRKIKSIKISAMSAYDGQITIGDTSSKSIQIMAAVDSMLVEGQKINVYESVKLDDGTYQDIPMGKYTILSLKEKDGITVIEGAGPLSTEAYTPYFSKLTYPTDTIQILKEISLLTGVPINTGNLTPIAFGNKPEGYVCREIIGYIAAMYGKNAVEERDGSISLKWYESQETDIFTDKTDSPEIKKSDFIINKLQCNVSSDVAYTKGKGTGITISNPFMTEEIMESVWKQVQGYRYRPAEINVKSGNPCIDQWDSYSYGIYNIICAKTDHKYDGGVQNTITCRGESETEADTGFRGPVTMAMERYSAELVLINEALLHKISAYEADIKYITNDKLTTIEADIKNAIIGSMSAEFATVGYLATNYAKIDLSNIEKATIGTVLAYVGLLTNATIENGHVTGYLDSVEVNANSITAGTLITDRLVFRGQEKSIVYELNNITGALQAVQSDTLNGEILTDRSITVDKIVAHSITSHEIATGTITANELNVLDIFGNKAVLETITASSVFSNAIAANSVVVGAKNTAINALNAINSLEIGGRNILINSSFQNRSSASWTIDGSSGGHGPTSRYGKACFEFSMTSLKQHKLIKQSVLGKLEPYTQYTLSGWILTENIVKGTTNPLIAFYQDGYYDNSGTSTWFGYGYQWFDLNSGTGEWKHVTWTFTTDEKVKAATYLNVYIYTRDYTGQIYFYDLKLEKGNKATDWTPAPEDISVENIYKENTTLIDGGKIYTGTVTANAIAANAVTTDKLSVGNGGNLYATGYDIFENIPNNPGMISYRYNATISIDTSTAYYGSRCLKISPSSADGYVYLGNVSNGYGCIPVVSGKTYIISAWMKASTTIAAQMYIVGHTGKDNKPAAHNVEGYHIGTSWVRVYLRYTASSTYPYVSIRIDNDTPGTTLWVDAIQIETGTATQLPSEFTPAGATIIDGAKILTGTVTANAIAAGAVTADKLSVSSLSAITANLGTVTAGTIDIETSSLATDYIYLWNSVKTTYYTAIGTYRVEVGNASYKSKLTPSGLNTYNSAGTAQSYYTASNAKIIGYTYFGPSGTYYVNSSGEGHFNGLVVSGTLRGSGTTQTLGTSTYPWQCLHATNIELYRSSAYIDFHFGSSTADYTARIIESSSGALKVYNSIASASDRRLKKGIVNLSEKYLDVLDKLKPSEYRYVKGDEYLNLGFVAQDVEEALKAAEITDMPLISVDNNNGMYTLDYNGIIPILTLAVQKLRKEVRELKAMTAK